MSKNLCDTSTRTRESSFGFRVELRDRVGLERVAHDLLRILSGPSPASSRDAKRYLRCALEPPYVLAASRLVTNGVAFIDEYLRI
jgi:hypothetical protein